MKLPLAILISVAGAALASSPAMARDGCGRGMERGPRGHCHAIGRWAGNNAWVVGRFYTGRGYWDGHRWYQNRYRHHGGWRYR
ncbi:hypothetical protein SPAN111604_07350 [Sphingomonas antarctica]|uniref:hypothetical protein n=1 Tax=Sphingomonas antarctica TaxID=2040274 RepID=UPI0039EA79A2